LDENSPRRPQISQAHTDSTSQQGSEMATLEAAGYKWHYALLWYKREMKTIMMLDVQVTNCA